MAAPSTGVINIHLSVTFQDIQLNECVLKMKQAYSDEDLPESDFSIVGAWRRGCVVRYPA